MGCIYINDEFDKTKPVFWKGKPLLGYDGKQQYEQVYEQKSATRRDWENFVRSKVRLMPGYKIEERTVTCVIDEDGYTVFQFGHDMECYFEYNGKEYIFEDNLI